MNGTSHGIARVKGYPLLAKSYGTARTSGSLVAAAGGVSRGVAAGAATLTTSSSPGQSVGRAFAFARLSGARVLIVESQFPVDAAWGAQGGPEFKTDIAVAKRGPEQRNIGWEQARKKFTLSQEVLTDPKKFFLMQFARSKKGAEFAFRFRDFFDYQAVNEAFVPAVNPIGWTSPAGPWQLCKTYSDTARSYTFRIFKPCTGLVADANGVFPPVPIIYNGSTPLVVNVDYTIDFTTGLVTMLGGTVPTNWTGWFDIPARFTDDSARFLLTCFNNSNWPDIQFTEQRMDNSIA